MHAEQHDLLRRIRESGQLSDEDEETLGKAVAEFVSDFGADFDEEGQPLDTGAAPAERPQRSGDQLEQAVDQAREAEAEAEEEAEKVEA
jgi:hypothetical protein